MRILSSVISSIGNKTPVLAGPTAVGKTDFAIQLSNQMDGEIISVDSRQIYRGFCIGTAQPSSEYLNSVPHHLIGMLNADTIVSSGKYAVWVNNCMRKIRKRHRRPVLVGGSFLYLQSVVSGIIREADTDPLVREKILREIDQNGISPMMDKLHKIDPDYAEIVHPNDIKRLVRALEIYEITGTPPSEIFYRQRNEDIHLRDRFFVIGLTCDRSILNKRIENRVDEMIEAGWLQETKKLLTSGVNPQSHAMQSLGYKQLVMVVQGSMTLDEAITVIKQKTRQFAKKQMTWMNKMSIDMILSYDVSLKGIS